MYMSCNMPKNCPKKPKNKLGFFGRRPLCKSSCYSSKKFEANNIKMDHMYCSQWKLFVFLLSENSKNSVTYFSWGSVSIKSRIFKNKFRPRFLHSFSNFFLISLPFCCNFPIVSVQFFAVFCEIHSHFSAIFCSTLILSTIF